MTMFAKIIPLTKLPRGLDFFDYKISQKFEKIIKVGSLVEIPFKQQKILGVVLSLDVTSNFKHLKEISDIKSTVPILSDKQLELAKWFSEHFFYSLASTIKIMIPPIPKKIIVKCALPQVTLGQEKFAITSKIKKLTTSLLDHEKNFFLINSYNQKLKNELLVNLCLKFSSKKKQLLILIPHLEKIRQFLKILPQKLSHQVAVITSDLIKSKNNYFKTWKKISLGEKSIIIGTRLGVFINFFNLGAIFIDQAESEDYKNWDQNPRYQTITVAQKIQELWQCKLFISSPAFRPEDYYFGHMRNAPLIKLGQPPKIKIINLIEERRREFTYLSEPLLDQITQIINKKQKAFLIVNKKGFASYLYCQDCKYIPNCLKCNLPLTFTDNQLKCFHCQIQVQNLLSCPICYGTNIKALGIGIEQIEFLLKKHFPLAKISTDLKKPADIYLSTAQITNFSIFKNIHFLGFVYIDSLMHLPDFSTNFKIYQMIQTITANAKLVAPPNLQITIQTCLTNNHAIKFLNQDYQKFYQAEMKARKLFSYPPYSILIKLFFQHHDKTICQKEATDLYHKLQKSKINASQPYLYYKIQIRGRFRTQILLKFSSENSLKSANLPKLIPNYWTIDREPISML